MYKLILSASLLALSATAVAEKGGKYDSDKMVCKSMKITGTRLARERVCLTRAQWDKMAAETQENHKKSIDNSLDKSGPRG